MTRLKLYAHLVKMGFVELMAFRITVIMLALSIPITLFARYYVFAALYENESDRVAGYDLKGILTYLVIAWLLRSFFRTGTDRRLGREVRNGNVVFDLMRPVNFLTLTFFRGLGKSLNRALIISLPLIVIFAATDILSLPDSPQHALSFVASAGIGYLLAFELQLIVGLMAFFIGYNINIIWTFDLIIQILSGLLLPLHFFPEAFARTLELLPFGHIYYLPAQIYLGQVEAASIGPQLVTGLAWVLVLAVANQLVYRIAVRKLTIAGG